MHTVTVEPVKKYSPHIFCRLQAAFRYVPLGNPFSPAGPAQTQLHLVEAVHAACAASYLWMCLVQGPGDEKKTSTKSPKTSVDMLRWQFCVTPVQGMYKVDSLLNLQHCSAQDFLYVFLKMAEGLTNWSVKHITQVRISRPLPPPVDWMHAQMCYAVTTWGKVQKRLKRLALTKAPHPK